MRVAYAYGVLTGGGCERRMGDLCRWLRSRDHEAWILGSYCDDLGRRMLHEQCGVAEDRVLLSGDKPYGDWLRDALVALRPDVVDVQWGECVPERAPCPIVYTMHGITQGVPPARIARIISVEALPPAWTAAAPAPVRVIYNWVDTAALPFSESLPAGGLCFFGRAFKAVNAAKACRADPGLVVDCYGTSHVGGPLPEWPPGLRWHGYARPEEVIPRYRVVFATAIVALEALALGRLVIAGQEYAGRPPYGHLVMPHDLPQLSDDQFAADSRPGAREPDPGFVRDQVALAHESDWTTQRLVMRRYVEEHHDWARQCEAVFRVYEEVAG